VQTTVYGVSPGDALTIAAVALTAIFTPIAGGVPARRLEHDADDCFAAAVGPRYAAWTR
jgi:hypothetical protein